MAIRREGIQPKAPTAELSEQIAAARSREIADRQAGLRAVAVEVDPARRRVLATLTTGDIFGFSFSRVPGLDQASPEEQKDVSLSPSGSGIHWESIDADVSVPGLVVDIFGKAATAANLGAAGGRAKSRAKAAAARANGKRGGRPKLKRPKARSSRKPAGKN